MRPSANYWWASRPSLSLIATICRPTQRAESHLSPSLSRRGAAVYPPLKDGTLTEVYVNRNVSLQWKPADKNTHPTIILVDLSTNE